MSLDQDAATLCYALYEYSDSPKVSWDYHDDGMQSNICWALVRLRDIAWIVYRGSVTHQDWQRDFYDWYDPFLHDSLGLIHPGFYEGLPQVIDKALSLIREDEVLAVTGHSLGAGRATLATGLLCLKGRAPLARIVFGEPHSGTKQLAQVIRPVASLISFRADGGPSASWEDVDEVTRVPPWFDVPTPRTDVTVTPQADDPWGPFRYHHMSLYAKALGLDQTWDG